jgi:hypothetical protein
MDYASSGVPLPFLSFFVSWPGERSERSETGKRKQPIEAPRFFGEVGSRNRWLFDTTRAQIAVRERIGFALIPT